MLKGGNGFFDNLDSGEISHTDELGFVNWQHAIPDRVKEAYDIFINEADLAKDSFSFSYGQRLNYSIIGSLRINYEVSEERKFQHEWTL